MIPRQVFRLSKFLWFSRLKLSKIIKKYYHDDAVIFILSSRSFFFIFFENSSDYHTLKCEKSKIRILSHLSLGKNP